MIIFVNTSKHNWTDPTISYEDVVRLADKKGQPTVTYVTDTGMSGWFRTGSLAPGKSLYLATPGSKEDRIIFNCFDTSKT
jgi:hypothetical protein